MESGTAPEDDWTVDLSRPEGRNVVVIIVSITDRGVTVSRVVNCETTPTEWIEAAKVTIRVILYHLVLCERKEKKYSTYFLETMSEVKNGRIKVCQTFAASNQ